MTATIARWIFALPSLLLLVFVTSPAWSLPRDEDQVGAILPTVDLVDEEGRKFSTRELKGLPVIFIPIYARCPSACPLTVRNLKRALAESGLSDREYQVILFTFDTSEGPPRLREFRRKNQVPLHWRIANSTRGGTQILMDSIGFRYISANGEFNHPDLTAFLSPDLVITRFVPGSRLDRANVESGIRAAQSERTALGHAGPWLLALSIFGLLSSSFAAAHLYVKCRSESRVA